MVVAGMAAYTDINKAHEIANEIRRVNRQLKEAQSLSVTYNNRERLFGMPITNVSVI
jgi:dynein heavy chain